MKVFIAGPRAVSKLNTDVETRLKTLIDKGITVLVGDANGIDKAVQEYYSKSHYENVIVYSSAGKTRNNLGKWKVESVEVEKGLRGFDFFQQKDMAMAKDADHGFMIWNGESKGTLSNIINLISFNKKVLVYFLSEKQFITLNKMIELNELLLRCPEKTQTLYNDIINKLPSIETQLSLFDLPGENDEV